MDVHLVVSDTKHGPRLRAGRERQILQARMYWLNQLIVRVQASVAVASL